MIPSLLSIHRKQFVIILALVMLAGTFIGSPSAAASTTEQKIDAVLAIDVSTSMNQSDVNKVANEAMKMFIDMMPVQGDRLSIISYTDQIIRQRALFTIHSAQDKQDLKQFIDQLTRGPYTDIAVGVAEAVRILESGTTPEYSPMAVLLTDGNNYLNSAAERTQEESDRQLQEAVQRAQELSIPIYTIGLNADGQLNRDILRNIADETGGKSFVTDSADSLPQILSEIFADHLRLNVVSLTDYIADGEFHNIELAIPNANVMEANISIMSAQPVEVKLTDPSGQERPIPSDGVIFSQSAAYSLLKLTSPAQGNWLLQVRGVNQDRININLIYNYDLALVMEPLPADSTFAPGDSVTLRAWLEGGGQQVADADLYNNLTAVALLTDLDTQQTVEHPLINSGSDFSGSVPLPEAHDYELRLRVEDANFFRETAVVAISAKSGATQPSPAATPSSQAPPGGAGQESSLLPLIAGGVGFIILLIALALFILSWIKKKNKGFYGQFVIEITDEDTGERTSPQYRRLNTFKGKVKLHQLLQLAPELAETEKIIFTPGSDSVIITNQSGCLIEKSGRALEVSRSYELKSNDRIKITLQNVNRSIRLEYLI